MTMLLEGIVGAYLVVEMMPRHAKPSFCFILIFI